jgi:RNA polymerase subunit RPABC4/transcription elongation factor Spt4
MMLVPMLFDYSELDNRLTDADATRECLVCGSEDVNDTDKGFLLVEVPPDGVLNLGKSASGLYCGARVCNRCGYVHLHTEAPVRL